MQLRRRENEDGIGPLCQTGSEGVANLDLGLLLYQRRQVTLIRIADSQTDAEFVQDSRMPLADGSATGQQHAQRS